MNQPACDFPAEMAARSAPSAWMSWRMWGAAFLALSGAYALVFWITETFAGAKNVALWSICNALPHVVCAVPIVDRLARYWSRRRSALAWLITAGAVLLYALVAYGGVIFLLAITERIPSGGIFVRFFAGPALPWQLLQGSAYGWLAFVTGLWLDAERRLRNSANPPSMIAPQRRWLVKVADAIIPIDPADIIRIEAAGEYCTLVLPNQSHFARIGMGECVRRLGDLPFLRVHRSHLVHSEAIVRAETAGNGRIQITLSNGDQIITSREGARLVRGTAI